MGLQSCRGRGRGGRLELWPNAVIHGLPSTVLAGGVQYLSWLVLGKKMQFWEILALTSDNPVWYVVGGSLLYDPQVWTKPVQLLFAGLLLGGSHYVAPKCEILSMSTVLFAPASNDITRAILTLKCWIDPGFPLDAGTDNQYGPSRGPQGSQTGPYARDENAGHSQMELDGLAQGMNATTVDNGPFFALSLIHI